MAYRSKDNILIMLLETHTMEKKFRKWISGCLGMFLSLYNIFADNNRCVSYLHIVFLKTSCSRTSPILQIKICVILTQCIKNIKWQCIQ